MLKADTYLLLCLEEEAIEIAHAISKVIRFTPHDSHTIGGPTNIMKLQHEFNDMLAIVEMLEEHGFSFVRNQKAIDAKKQRTLDYMDYSRKLGVVC
jgi:hypothetical protein